MSVAEAPSMTRAAKGAKPKIRVPYANLKRLLTAYVVVLIFVLYLPLAVVALLSFSETGAISFPMGEPTVRWYGEVATNNSLLASLGRSLMIGSLSAAVATLMALMLGLGFRHDTRLKPFALGLILLPLLLPGVVGGAVLFVFFGILGFTNGPWTTVLPAHVVYVLPFAFLTLSPRLKGFNRTIEEAAVDLGARPTVVFTRVVWPIVKPAVFATFLFAFTLSFDEFIRTLFVTGFDRTVPVLFWVTITEQGAPYLPAMAVIIMLISIAASAAAFMLDSKKN